MASFILIMLWVKYELSYDRFHDSAGQIYRLISYTEQGGKPFRAAVTPAPSGKFLMDRIPDIINYTTFRPATSNMLVNVVAEDSTQLVESFYQQNRIYADSNFFELFSFPFISGSPDILMNDPKSVAISQRIAGKYFGDIDPVGKSLRLFDRENFVITSVFSDIPDNSHLKFDFVIPWEYLMSVSSNANWGNFYYNNYLQLNNNANIEEVNVLINEAMSEIIDVGDIDITFYLQPLTDVHLKSNMDIDLADSESEVDNDVYYFTIIAFFILLIACINFVNLTTAIASGRSKEVGLKKVVGASRKQLIRQFLGETVMYSVCSFAIAILIIILVMPAFSELTGKDLDIFMTGWEVNFLILLGLVIFTGFLSGIYPAYYLSSFQAAGILKGNQSKKGNAASIRKSLFVVQIGITVMLIISTLVVRDQLKLVKTKNLGYNKEHLMYLPVRGDILDDRQGLKAFLLADPSITELTTSSDIPTTTIHLWGGSSWEGMEPDEEKLFYYYTTDFDFQKTMKITMKEGRWFEMASDSGNYVINESAARHMGMDDPLGKWYSYGDNRGRIIGIMEDFHFKSLREKVEPLIVRTGYYSSYIIARHAPGMEARATDRLREAWEFYNPQYPFEYHSLEAELDSMYIEEQRKETLYGTFTALAIIISCLGLFGLAAYTIKKRKREIAIRKVVGASMSNLLVNLSTGFLWLGILANVVIWPLTWYLMNNWLENFTYRVNIKIIFFVYALVISLVIIILTLTYHLVKAARDNPVDAIRYE